MRFHLNGQTIRFCPLTQSTTHIKSVLGQIRLLTGLNVGGKTRNIAIQLVLQQCCNSGCTFFVARFSAPLELNQVKRIPQDFINEFVIRKWNPLVVVDFRFMFAFLLA